MLSSLFVEGFIGLEIIQPCGIVMKANAYACDSRDLWNTHKFRGDINSNEDVQVFFRNVL